MKITPIRIRNRLGGRYTTWRGEISRLAYLAGESLNGNMAEEKRVKERKRERGHQETVEQEKKATRRSVFCGANKMISARLSLCWVA